jgi:superfamily II DNA or RNA helicase
LAGNNRKKFLAATKTKFANILLAKLKEKKLICFANNIPQAEYLSRKKNCIHSKIGKTERETILNNFNEGKIDKLFAVGMLREGVNLKGIEAGVIVQLDNVERMFTQILGQVRPISL